MITTSIITVGFIDQQSFAQDVYVANDCANDYSLIRSDEIIGISDNNIFPQKLLDIAIKNHAAYCCDHYRGRLNDTSICQQKDIQEKMKNNHYAESPVFYDHLIDVGFRYIDGDAEKQYSSSNDGPIIDIQGKTWREKSMAVASAPFGSLPGALWQDFGQAWGMHAVSSIQLHIACQDNKAQYRDFSIHRGEKSLSEKYFMICHAAQCINPQQQWTTNTDRTKCMTLAQQRIKAEMDRVQSVMITQWNTAIVTSFQAYAQWFLVHDQMNTLLEKYSEMDAWFTFLNNKVPEVVPMCSG